MGLAAKMMMVALAMIASSCAGEASEDGDSSASTLSASAADTATASATPRGDVEAVSEPPVPFTGVEFFEDFVSAGSLGRFDFDVYHRDDSVVAEDSWLGDHSVVGPGDVCGPPDETRSISRGDRSEGFNDEWIYRCVPDGDLTKAHLMTSIGDTSGYSIGAFSPKESFSDVREVRWDINITDLGNRQFPEVKLIPVENFDFQKLPCTIEWLPCDTQTTAAAGAVSTSFHNHDVTISDRGNRGIYWAQWGSQWLNANDPALSSVKIRREHFLRDNQNGTLTFGIEQPDGTFFEYTSTGSFPQGPVRVVFADHSYTPDKDGPVLGHTWHWDNIRIVREP